MPEAPPAEPSARPRRSVGRPRRREGDDATKGRLVQAAIEAFSARELERVRLEDVARAAGITRPSPLHHCGSKAGLYDLALAHSFEALAKALRGAMAPTGTYEARIAQLGQTLSAFDDAHRTMLAMIFRGLLRDDDRARALVRRVAFPLLDDLEAFVRDSAGEAFPVRAFLLSTFANEMLHSVLGDFGQELCNGDVGRFNMNGTCRTTAPVSR